jgi:anti-sigma B factor antagonist
MEVTSHSRGAVAVLELAGRFDAYVAPRVAEGLEQATAAPPARVVVNLAGVAFMDSTALGTLVRGMKRCRQHGGDLHLCGLQQPVRIVFELTRLDTVFKIFGSEEEAVHAFGS